MSKAKRSSVEEVELVTEVSGDRWAVGDAYDAYMGRWSRLVARAFVAWLDARGGHWLEVGCGTGALTANILASCEPSTIVACEPSASFVAHARERVVDPRVAFVVAGADALPSRTEGFDVLVSGLVLNFVNEPAEALATMRQRVRVGGTVAAYVWDYAGGVDLLRHFWEQAALGDANAAALDEARRFATWQAAHLKSLWEASGLVGVACETLTVATTFADFDDYWGPFLGGAGPAPSYVASLRPAARDGLEARLRACLPRSDDGSIRLQARAFAVRGTRG